MAQSVLNDAGGNAGVLKNCGIRVPQGMGRGLDIEVRFFSVVLNEQLHRADRERPMKAVLKKWRIWTDREPPRTIKLDKLRNTGLSRSVERNNSPARAFA